MRRKEQADLFFSEMVRMQASQVAPTVEKLVDTLQGKEVVETMMSLATVLLILLHKYDISYTDVLGMADCMVFPSAKNFTIAPELEEIAKKI
jgi:phosphoribosyl-ATP pyrophosphohydrolase